VDEAINFFLRALVISAIIIGVTDALMFYLIWIGKAKITPLVVISTIIVTMISLTLNLWVHVFRYLGKVESGSASG